MIYKKLLVPFVLLTVFASFSIRAFAFSDTNGHLNEDAIDYLYNEGVVEGYGGGVYAPNNTINRAELMKVLVVSQGIEPDPAVYQNCFPDVKTQWFAPYICYAKEQGWVAGYSDGTFKPDQKITRVEAIKVILEALFEGLEEGEVLAGQTTLDIDTDQWYGKYFIFADNRDLLDKQHVTVDGEGYYYLPGENISRKEVAESIYRSIVNFSLSFL